MNLNYVKTLLYAYPHLLSIIKQIDDIVMRKALSSMRDFSPCVEQCEKIINLTEQKKVLINLKIKLDKMVGEMSGNQLDMLDYKYFKQKPKEYYALFDATSRSYFRRQLSLVKKVNGILEREGLSNEWFEKYCLRISFLFELLRRVIEGDKRNKKRKVKRKKPCVQLENSLSA